MVSMIKAENSNLTPNNGIREFLQSKIQNLESRVIGLTQYSNEEGKQGALDLLTIAGNMTKTSLDILSNLYLEYSLVSDGEESVVYAHRAVALNPDIQISQKPRFLRDISGVKIQNGNVDQRIVVIQGFYSLEKTPGQMKVLESFLDGIKSEAHKKGEGALDFHESAYRMIQEGNIPDPYKYEKDLSELDDSQLEEEKLRNIREEMGVGSFLKDMLLSKEEDTRDRKRWEEGTKLPKVSFGRLKQIYSPNYPKHVIIGEDALGGINLGHSRRYEPLDEVCDNISLEMSKRLPRRIDAYRFRQDYANDEIEIDGIGKIKVQLHQTGDGIFTSINTIESDSFRIWNCRGSGRQYLNRFNDTGLPNEIKIRPKNIEVHLYEDGPGNPPSERERKKIASWLQKNILEKIVATPEYENQAKEVPEAVQYPCSMGALYTWLLGKKAEKLEITVGDSSKVYPHEKAALSPGWRLASLGIGGDFPEEAHNSFIWCGIGEAKPNSDSQEYMIPGHHMDSNFNSYHNKLVQINPKNGEDVFVVDYQAWDEYRDSVFKENLSEMSREIVKKKQLGEFVDRMYNLICDKPEDSIIFGEDRTEQATEMGWKLRLNDEQANEIHRVLAKTLVPVTEYKGNYQKPVVLISRALSFDEVKIVPGVEYKPR